MTNNQNMMILNGNDIGISKIELSKGELYIVDEMGKYSLCVHIYNWKEINSAEIGKRQNIEFNEYDFSDACYMNKRNCFDIELNSVEVKVNINYKDVQENSIVYRF